MKRICVFSGSNFGARDSYTHITATLAKSLYGRNIDLVYGGAKVGLMGVIADEMLRLGGQVTGVIPKHLQNLEVSHDKLTDLKIVGSMHERKALMEELSDGFIALPGGIGTLEELFEIFTWGQLGLHNKPFGLLNVDGFYDQLQGFMNHMVEEGFLRSENAKMVMISEDPNELLDLFERYEPLQVKKWIDRSET